MPTQDEGFYYDDISSRIIGTRNGKPLWSLSFFQKGLDDILINNFENDVVQTYGRVSVRTIIEVERNRNFSDLRDIYKRTLKKTNDTSVCLKSHYLDIDSAVILTGDCPIGECWADFSSFFSLATISHLCLYQLAHHGSTSAWKSRGSDKMITHSLQADLRACWFVAYSKKNNRHVSKKVLNEFSKRGRKVDELTATSVNDYFP